jgi:hypothetical protein
MHCVYNPLFFLGTACPYPVEGVFLFVLFHIIRFR